MNGSVLFEGNPILSGSLNVNTGGNIEPLEIEINENGTREITPPSGVDGYAPITIETNIPQVEPVLETLNVTQNGRYEPPSGVAGFDEVNVEVLHPLDTLTVTENGSYEPPTGVYGFSNVNVNVPIPPSPVLNTLNVSTNGTYTPPSGVDGYDKVNVNVPLPENAYLLEEYEDVPTDIASFTASDAPLKSLTVSIEPVQAGSGDPSPTNVRPISGWTNETITVTDDLQNPTVTHTTTIPFTDSQGNPVEVYGGSVNVVDGGEQPRTLESLDLGDLSWSYTNNIFYATLSADSYKYVQDTWSMCSCYNYVGTVLAGTSDMQNKDDDSYALYYNPSYPTSRVIYVKDTRYTDATTFTTAISGQKICYELATPTTFYTQPTSIKSLDGVNNVFASTGQIEELKFYNR